jgi:hypothetical protein
MKAYTLMLSGTAIIVIKIKNNKMKKITVCLIIFQLLLFAGCKKQVCFKCRDADFADVYVKATDTIIVLGNASRSGIKNLIDSGYTRSYSVGIWQNNYVVICNDEGIKTFGRDSC